MHTFYFYFVKENTDGLRTITNPSIGFTNRCIFYL